jgi:ATP/ADP translocase
MRGNLIILASGLLVLAILSPLVMLYTLALAFWVAVVNPLGHVYRIARYGIQSDPLEWA